LLSGIIAAVVYQGELMMLQNIESSGQSEGGAQMNPERRLYQKPQILHEFELETYAGSPFDNFIDPLDLDQLP
jgi:hypothetical protein